MGKSILDAWETYSRLVLQPRGADETSVRASQIAFYSGVHVALSELSDVIDASDSPDAIEQFLDEWWKEAETFHDDVKSGS